MSAKLNHTIVAARDRNASALFLSEILGLEAPVVFGPFTLVKVGDELTLDFMETRAEIRPQHYAFLVSETEFDQIFSRIEARHLQYWADPHRSQRDQINHWDDGRGTFRGPRDSDPPLRQRRHGRNEPASARRRKAGDR